MKKLWKRYREEPGALNGDWHETTESDIIKCTETNGYYSPHTVLSLLSRGAKVSTPWADFIMSFEMPAE